MPVFGTLEVASGSEAGNSYTPPSNRMIVAFMETGGIGLKPQTQDDGSTWRDVYTVAGNLIEASIADKWFQLMAISGPHLRLYKLGGFDYLYSYYEITPS